MRFTTGKPDHDLTYDDVFMSPTRSSVRSRMEVDLTSTDALELPTPLIVANMTAISGRRMAETVARRGAVSIIPQDLSPSAATDAIARVKSAHTGSSWMNFLAPQHLWIVPRPPRRQRRPSVCIPN